MAIHLKIVGFLLMALAAMHVFFPRYFNWKTELKLMSLINRQMMLVHAFFIALVALLMGLLCMTYADDLITTNLGRAICLGLGIFWIIRLVIQFFGYSSTLWKGKAFETTVHVVFSLLWVYFGTVFLCGFFFS